MRLLEVSIFMYFIVAFFVWMLVYLNGNKHHVIYAVLWPIGITINTYNYIKKSIQQSIKNGGPWFS